MGKMEKEWCVHAYLVDVAQPFAYVFEALGVGDVIHQHDAHGSSVVGGGDGVEALLAGCVPAQRRIVIDNTLSRLARWSSLNICHRISYS